ncbi:unnamed protein product [Lactuca saligna]|uniref:Uncharacterized protein n=1 Tax=Lactuca saligna TaxID=75948 RepID=A0AA36A1W6_LACSI|nr:unnamed protein product [Lactuca saligna]
MLNRVDPKNHVLVAYVKTIDSSIPTGISLPQEEKKTKKSKKIVPTSPEPKKKGSKTSKSSKKETENIKVTSDETNVVEPMVDETQENVIIPSKTGMFRRIKMKSTKKKVIITEAETSSRRYGKTLSQPKKKKLKNTCKLFLSTESTDEDERIPETPKFTPIVTSFIPEANVMKTPEVSIAKSIFDEVRTSGIPAHVSDMDANVNMGEGGSKDAAQGPIIVTPTSTIPLTSITVSPTFEHILNPPFTSIFPSQSTNTPKPSSPTDTDNEGFGGTFENLEFNEDEEEFPDHMLMIMKPYKILNQKLNSIIQSQVDLG